MEFSCILLKSSLGFFTYVAEKKPNHKKEITPIPIIGYTIALLRKNATSFSVSEVLPLPHCEFLKRKTTNNIAINNKNPIFPLSTPIIQSNKQRKLN